VAGRNGSRYVERFTLTERLLHWVHASAFFVLLGSWLVLYIPSLSVAVGRRPLMKDVHFWTGISWAGAILLIVALGNRRALRRTVREIDLFDRDDRRFLAGHTEVPQGRFNAGQKINAIVTAAFAVLFFVSGLLLWYGERDTRFRLPGTVFLHDTLMYASVLIVLGHLYLSLVHPATRHALRGMTLGSVRKDWARRHHEKWAREARYLEVQLQRPQAAEVEPRPAVHAHDLHQHRLTSSAADDGSRSADVDM
jgi:formate dehydrogenase subunit gamma